MCLWMLMEGFAKGICVILFNDEAARAFNIVHTPCSVTPVTQYTPFPQLTVPTTGATILK